MGLDAHRKRVQGHHGRPAEGAATAACDPLPARAGTAQAITLTGLYNVLEKLRASEPLTDKDKLIHDQGLVSILKQLHDDLDAAVFAAYGWPASLTDADILTRLVALNTARAAEEKQGIIHWLRPDYQHPQAPSPTQDNLDLPASANPQSAIPNPQSKTPWPKPLAERIQAIEAALRQAPAPTTAASLTQGFTRASPADIQEILETLVVMGRAHQMGEMFSS